MNELQSDRPVRQFKEKQIENNQKQEKNFMNVRINADDQSSNTLIFYSAIIISALVLVSVLAQYAIPSAVNTLDASSLLAKTSLELCNNDLIEINKTILCGFSDIQLKRGQFISGGIRLNQFFAFYLKFQSGFMDHFKQKVYFRLSKVSRFEEYNKVNLILGENLLQKQVEVNQIPDLNGLIYLDFINKLVQGEEFYWQIQLKINSILQNYNFSLQTKTINPQYTIFSIALKSTFFLISLLVLIFSLKKLRKCNFMDSLPEQRMTLMLSFLTVTFNDPFYAITLLLPNIFTTVLSTMFFWNFITLLMIIWVFFLLRIKDQESQVQTKLFNINKWLPFILFYLITLGQRIFSSIYQGYQHPLIDNVYRSNQYLGLAQYLTSVVFIGVIYYICSLYLEINQSRLDLMWRSKVFLGISFFFFVVVICLFIMGAFEVFCYSSKKFIFSITFMNIYSYYLQYLYYESKFKDDQFQKEVTKKEHSFIEFQDKEISIDLQRNPFQDLQQLGKSKIQDQNQTTVSYLGQCFKNQGSQIVYSSIRESKPQPSSREEKL